MAERANTTPLVSVVIPAHNSAETIRRAVDSAIAQVYRPLEIVIVDDCSSDGTQEIAKSYPAQLVRTVPLAKRAGASGARNAGVEAARGDLIAFLDSDDEWHASKIGKQVDLIAKDESISFVSCAANLISADGHDLGDIYRGVKPLTGPNAWKALLENNFVATPTVLTKRQLLLDIGGFDPTLRIGEDQDMWIRLALSGSFAYVPESLVRVHVREHSLSSGSFDDQLRYTLPMVEGHIAKLGNRLSSAEVKTIMAERLWRLGQVAYARGARREGYSLILRSISYGHSRLGAWSYLANVSRFAWRLKRALGVQR